MKRQGFSLLEMLLVTALVASISLAVFLCLSNGLKLWKKMQAVRTAEAVTVFFDRLAVETANAFLFSTLSVEGEISALTFPTIIYAMTDAKSSRVDEVAGEQIGVVRYFYDEVSGQIVRQQADYGRAVHGNWQTPVQVAPGVSSLRFLYYYPGSSEALPFKEGQILPAGIMVEVEWVEQKQNRKIARYFVLPAGV